LSVDTLLDAVEQEGVAPQANLAFDYPIEYLNSLTFSGLPPHKLRLKPGSLVMLLRNLCIKQGLCNGVRLKVLEIKRKVLKCEIISGSCIGNIAMLPRIALNPDDDLLPFPMQRLQFPIKLAYCMTINKAQGQSLSRIAIHLIDDVFGHGQLYVAVSRAIAKSRLKIYIGEGVVDDGRPVKIRNVVYQQALKFSE
jgi:ATP-dependent DNA helicase PIF1